LLNDPSRLIVGWQEWVALPDLGLPALKAKIDTGAKTSALHTHLIEPFGTARNPKVRFSVRPSPDKELEVLATADIVDRREVASSNGGREMRYVIETRLSIGGRDWPIEVTLTNREQMTYRMLIGRQAIRSDMLVDCAASFRQPRLSYRLYAGL
jgi:ribosomal protein S6--L-glutamate ligase